MSVYALFCLLIVSVLSADDCSTKANCGDCTSSWNCVWCSESNSCLPGGPFGISSDSVQKCGTLQWYYKQCNVAQVWTITAASACTFVLLAIIILIVCCCCCCKKKRTTNYDDAGFGESDQFLPKNNGYERR